MPWLIILACLFCQIAIAEEPDLFRDLMIVNTINAELCDHFPASFNHQLEGGYFNMPSSRMGEEGEIGISYASVPPYGIYSVRAQLFRNLEVSGNYRIFTGIPDPVFGHLGFGDFADKGGNIKFALVLPEDSDFQMPGISIGVEDCLGTRTFNAQYIVATQVIRPLNLELTLGYGNYRIKGLFGGFLWMPFRKSCTFLRNISLVGEYDAIDYSNAFREPHPEGRNIKSRFNYGLKARFWDCFDLSTSYVRGNTFAIELSAFYNFGKTKGFIPKINDPLPYRAPVVTEPIGILRTEEILSTDLVWAFCREGFTVLDLLRTTNSCFENVLRIHLWNCKWLFECEVRSRLNAILSKLTPENIDHVVVVMESEGFPVQEYHYRREFLEAYAEDRMGDTELYYLTPLTDYSPPEPLSSYSIYHKKRFSHSLVLGPKLHTFFGSTTGKFKYALGVSAGIQGFLPGGVYYECVLGDLFVNKLENIGPIDILNPSQLLNVQTDIVNYYKQHSVTFDRIYVQKCVNLNHGFFGRVGIGYFEQNYGGVATELLFYPSRSPFAIGFEAALLKKRQYTGLGFSNTIRQYKGVFAHNVPFTGYQYFVDFYYDCADLDLNLKVSVGQFLARDFGGRIELTRYFSNGLRLYAWYTPTNGNDRVNGAIYYDKGVGFSLPLDIFYTYSCRNRWSYGMSAWLRDVGYRGPTGRRLYEMIYDTRSNN